MASITVTQLKADFLTLLDEANKSPSKITVTKRGRPIAKFGPPKRRSYPSAEGRLAHLLTGFPDMEVRDYDLEWDTDEDRLNY